MTPAIKPKGEDVKSGGGTNNFEEAITESGYGKFNYLLLLAILPASCASIFSSSSMSYVLPSAECDLRLTMFDKGLLNSVSYAGMISTAFFWGFMADTFGRRGIMLYGYLLNGILSLATCFSHTSWLLITLKFFDGVIISGPYASLMSYLAEVHDDVHRSRIYMWQGVFFSIGNISVPCIAWLIITRKWEWMLFGANFKIDSWRLFLAVCSLPEFLACVAVYYFPESPRYLLFKGRKEEALNVFKRIYAMNTGNHPESYSIKKIEDESTTPEMSIENNCQASAYNAWIQTKPLFLPPNVFKLLVIALIQFGATIGSNTLRLWMPQLFTMIENYKSVQTMKGVIDDDGPPICRMLNGDDHSINNLTNITNTINIHEPTCITTPMNSQVFINSIIIALTGVIGYTLAGSLINIIGKKKLMAMCFLIAASCCGSLYWAKDANGILALSSVFVAMSSIGGATVINVIVDNFPTCLRTMAVSMTMMIGRIGAVVGNLMFPVLFSLSCLGPFMMIGTACLASALLILLLPQKMAVKEKPVDLA